jgi:hypothetical protein
LHVGALSRSLEELDSSVDAQLVELSRALEKRDEVVLQKLEGSLGALGPLKLHLANISSELREFRAQCQGEEDVLLSDVQGAVGELRAELRNLYQEFREHAQGEKPGYREPLVPREPVLVSSGTWGMLAAELRDLRARVSELEDA